MKKALSILLTLVLVFSLFSCAKTPVQEATASTSPNTTPSQESTAPESATSEKEYGGVLKIVNTSEGATPLGVPWEIVSLDSYLIIPYAEGLIIETASGEYQPSLATEWAVDTENTTVTFTLRQGVKYTDGSDFNAESAAWQVQQAIDSKNFNANLIGVEVTGEYEIKAILSAWSNSILSTFAASSLRMVSMESFVKNGLDYARDHPVGTGPFVLKEYVRGEKIVYEKNVNYWQESKPYLDGLEYVFIRDVMTQSAALQATGEQGIDVLNTTSAELAVSLGGLDVYSENMASGAISLIPSSNDPNSPLSDIKVRQAISYAIDRDSLVAARGFGVLTPAMQIIPDAWSAHLPDSYNLSYNVDQAKALLAEAGYKDGFTTKLFAMPGIVDKDAVVAIQSMLAAVGITAELEFPDAGGYSNYRNKGWDGMLVQIIRAFPQIDNTFTLFFDVQKDAATGVYSHRYLPSAWRPYEELYTAQKASAATSSVEPALVQEVHKIMLENLICVPLYNVYDIYLIKNNVHDTGFTQWSASTVYLPADAWKSSK